MITVRHLTTGERQFVSTLAGIDLEVWEETAEAVPDDLGTRAWRAVEGVLMPRPPVLSLFDFLGLWTPAEALAVEDTTDTELRYAFLRLRGLALVDLAETEVRQGIARAQSLSILTEARAQRLLAGLPPE